MQLADHAPNGFDAPLPNALVVDREENVTIVEEFHNGRTHRHYLCGKAKTAAPIGTLGRMEYRNADHYGLWFFVPEVA
jgi:hypothetical protein